MKDKLRITREDVMMLLGKTNPCGVLSVHVGLPTSDRHDPGRWLSTVRSGLKELGQRSNGSKTVPALLEIAQAEISQLHLEARHRSLVYFRSLNPDWVFWRSLQAYVPDLFSCDITPQVRHLVALLDESPVLGVAVVSQERTRVFTLQEGVAEEAREIRPEELLEEARNQVPAAVSAGMAPVAARASVRPQSAAERTRRALAGVGQRLAEMGNASGWQRLLLIGPAMSTVTVAESLPEPWRRRLIEALDRNLIHAPLSELSLAASRHLFDWKRRAELREVEDLLSDAHSGRRACAGLESCLNRLHERQVERLYVSGDLRVCGFRDGNGRLYARLPEHVDAGACVPEPLLTERMVASALTTGATVIPLEGESAEKMNLSGGVGARLRWRGAGEPVLGEVQLAS